MSPVKRLAPDPRDYTLTTGDHAVDGLAALDTIVQGRQTTLNVDLVDLLRKAGPFRRTMDGGSTLTLDIADPDDSLIETPLINTPWTLQLGELVFESVQQRRTEWDSWQITLEDELVLGLKHPTEYQHAERGRTTRARFAKTVSTPAIKRVGGRFFCPEIDKVQPETRDEQRRSRAKGINPSQTLTIAGETASPAQLREVETSMAVANQEEADELECLAMLCAGIGESGFRAVMNAAGSPYGGVFQGKVKARGGPWDIDDTAGMARCFLRGGKGFQAGGAIHLAKTVPGITPGEIATRVEASGEPGAFYQAHLTEAKALYAAYGGATSTPVDDGEYVLKHGEPGKTARPWDTLEQLASDVNWRRWVVGLVLFFMSEDDLVRSIPRGVIEMRRRFDGLVGSPDIDLDTGKPADSINVSWYSSMWDAPPGTVIVVENSGKMDGRWIVSSLERGDLRDRYVDVELKRPEIARPEPAASSGATDTSSAGGAGDLSGITPGGAWAGTQRIFDQFVHPFMRRRGLTPGSQKRTTRTTSSGKDSDHWTGSQNSYATDYPTTNGEATARALAEEFGWTTWQANSYATHTVTIGGKPFRIQILWGAGVDHGDHIHVGIKAA